MLELYEKIISILIADAGVTAIVPATSIFMGPVDITMETQASLLYPSIVIFQVSEAVRTVPQGARDTQFQLDIWSRNSQLEVENIYEAVLSALDFFSGNQSNAHIFWERLDGAVDSVEGPSDRRVWHRALTFRAWSIKP